METVKIQHKDADGNDHMIINRSDYDPKKGHKLYVEKGDRESAKGLANPESGLLSEEEEKMWRELDARRRVQGNHGQTEGRTTMGSENNPDGTYATPTPSDIRFPNQDQTEFANNHGAFVGRSAAEMRASAGMPDRPGGIDPEGARATLQGAANAASAAAMDILDRGEAKVEIPDDWKDLSAAERKQLAIDLGAEDGVNAKDANEKIQAEYDRRKNTQPR